MYKRSRSGSQTTSTNAHQTASAARIGAPITPFTLRGGGAQKPQIRADYSAERQESARRDFTALSSGSHQRKKSLTKSLKQILSETKKRLEKSQNSNPWKRRRLSSAQGSKDGGSGSHWGQPGSSVRRGVVSDSNFGNSDFEGGPRRISLDATKRPKLRILGGYGDVTSGVSSSEGSGFVTKRKIGSKEPFCESTAKKAEIVNIRSLLEGSGNKRSAQNCFSSSSALNFKQSAKKFKKSKKSKNGQKSLNYGEGSYNHLPRHQRSVKMGGLGGYNTQKSHKKAKKGFSKKSDYRAQKSSKRINERILLNQQKSDKKTFDLRRSQSFKNGSKAIIRENLENINLDNLGLTHPDSWINSGLYNSDKLLKMVANPGFFTTKTFFKHKKNRSNNVFKANFAKNDIFGGFLTTEREDSTQRMSRKSKNMKYNKRSRYDPSHLPGDSRAFRTIDQTQFGSVNHFEIDFQLKKDEKVTFGSVPKIKGKGISQGLQSYLVDVEIDKKAKNPLLEHLSPSKMLYLRTKNSKSVELLRASKHSKKPKNPAQRARGGSKDQHQLMNDPLNDNLHQYSREGRGSKEGIFGPFYRPDESSQSQFYSLGVLKTVSRGMGVNSRRSRAKKSKNSNFSNSGFGQGSGLLETNKLLRDDKDEPKVVYLMPKFSAKVTKKQKELKNMASQKSGKKFKNKTFEAKINSQRHQGIKSMTSYLSKKVNGEIQSFAVKSQKITTAKKPRQNNPKDISQYSKWPRGVHSTLSNHQKTVFHTRMAVYFNKIFQRKGSSVSTPVSFFGVFTGEGDPHCANFMKENLRKFIFRNKHFPRNLSKAVNIGITNAAREYKKIGGRPLDSRCSASLLITFGKMGVVILVGSKDVFVCQHGGRGGKLISSRQRADPGSDGNSEV